LNGGDHAAPHRWSSQSDAAWRSTNADRVSVRIILVFRHLDFQRHSFEIVAVKAVDGRLSARRLDVHESDFFVVHCVALGDVTVAFEQFTQLVRVHAFGQVRDVQLCTPQSSRRFRARRVIGERWPIHVSADCAAEHSASSWQARSKTVLNGNRLRKGKKSYVRTLDCREKEKSRFEFGRSLPHKQL